MKKTFLLLAALAAFSCAKEEAPASSEMHEITFCASVDQFTKTTLDGASIKWSLKDTISLFSAADGYATNNMFVASEVSADGKTAWFKGQAGTSQNYLAAYPYSASLTATASGISGLAVPASQVAVAAGFADGSNPSQAVVTDGSTNLLFKNIGGIVGFQVAEDGIESATLSTSYALAGTSNSVTLNGAIEKNKTYYFVVAPGQMDGMSMTFVKNGAHATVTSTAVKTVARSGNYNMGVVSIPADKWSKTGITTAADLVAFAEAVNAGDYSSFTEADGSVCLYADIDMSSVKTWTPIGMPTSVNDANTACSYEGPSFKGVFNGKGHAIYNFNVNAKVAATSVYGLFGMLDGASVTNLTLGKAGDGSKVTVSAAGTADAGILAGAATNGATIENCDNYIPLNVEGTTATSSRFATGVFVGYACSTDKAVNLTSLVNNANITVASGNNAGNGATGVMAGGIAGFCTGSSTATTYVESCENRGNLTGSCGRSSGIVATMNAKTFMRYCVNRGNQVNDFVNGRIGNLTCIMGSGCSMDDCTNYGDVVTSNSSTTTAGMIALLNNANVVVTGGGNYGKVIGANTTYHGLLVANFSAFSSVKGVYAGGSCGTYAADGNHEMHTLTADNWMSHIGKYSDANLSKITDLSSPWGTGGGTPVTGNLPELKDASLRILFIGNSFTMDAVTHLPGIVNAAGITDITMAHLYYGGRTLPEYNTDREVANNTLYYSNPGAAKFTTASDKASIKDLANSGRWDVITIQEHTGNYRAWSWTTEEKAAIQNLIAYVVATQKVKPKVYYIMSQAYFDMSKIGSASKPYITWNSQAEMYDVIVAQTKKVLAECDVTDVIATGTMLQNLRTSSLDNDLNLTRDGYHMDYGIARYGAACTIFEKVIAPITGKKLDGNSFRYSSSTAGTTDVTDANAPIAIQAARYAVEKPFEVTSMSGAVVEEPSTDVTLKGSGTQADPYLISAGADMQQISLTLEEGVTKYFKMTGDIDMSSVADWTPVNTANKAMNIYFDGQNHTIKGFNCTNKNYASIFGLVSGTVKNLVVDSPVISHSSQQGVIATWLGNSVGSLSATIENVHVRNMSLTKTGTAAAPMGGIAANSGTSTISGCSVTGKITSSTTGGSWLYIGGIVGKVYVNSTIEKCSYSGDFNMAGGAGFGGIVGGAAADNSVTIKDCWSAGSIVKASYAGGIIGDICKNSSVTNCYSTMSISGTYCLAGIVGRASNQKNPNSSGTFSTDINIKVTNCIAWNPSIEGTNASETPASHYSSGAVVGFTTYLNALSGCWRNPALKFSVYGSAVGELNTLVDTPDCGPSAPLVKTSDYTYHCQYNGKAAGSSDTVSSLASSLGWSSSVWDLSGSLPTLK